MEKVALFHTCTVNYNEPEIGKATVGVFEKNEIEFLVPDQQCCGLPFLDVGLVDLAIKKIESNVAVLSQAVRQGYKIVVPAASCSYMLKQDYPRFLPTDDARLVAENTYDLSEYLMKVHGRWQAGPGLYAAHGQDPIPSTLPSQGAEDRLQRARADEADSRNTSRPDAVLQRA